MNSPCKRLRILVTGASGSGCTTLGVTLAERLGCEFFDSDHYFWRPTTPPYQQTRDPEERRQLLEADLARCDRAVIAGSVAGWGEAIERSLTMIVFLLLDSAIRVERLRKREIAKLGKADEEFLAWAAQYEEGKLEGRSRARQEAWLKERQCLVVRIEGDLSVEARRTEVLRRLEF